MIVGVAVVLLGYSFGIIPNVLILVAGIAGIVVVAIALDSDSVPMISTDSLPDFSTDSSGTSDGDDIGDDDLERVNRFLEKRISSSYNVKEDWHKIKDKKLRFDLNGEEKTFYGVCGPVKKNNRSTKHYVGVVWNLTDDEKAAFDGEVPEKYRNNMFKHPFFRSWLKSQGYTPKNDDDAPKREQNFFVGGNNPERSSNGGGS